jgi:molecular chaperone DnaK
VEVTFDIDANGILNVSAKDKNTGKSQNIRIEASSGLSKEDIEKMKREAEINAESDKKLREEAEKINQADGLIFQTEKQLKEYGDKLPADKKAPIEEALAELKTAHADKNIPAIDAGLAKLQTVVQGMYEAMKGAEGAQGADANADANTGGNGSENVTDVPFEEVKEEEQK